MNNILIFQSVVDSPSVLLLISFLVALAAWIFIYPLIIIFNIYFDVPGINLSKSAKNLGLKHDEVSIKTRDGIKLHGTIIFPANMPLNDKNKIECPNAIIVFHGLGVHQGNMIRKHATWLAKKGFIQLYINFRNHGKSEKQHRTSIGYLERLDVIAAIDFFEHFLKTSLNASKYCLFLLGESMGAAAILFALSKHSKYQEKVAGIILDSPYARLDRALNDYLRGNGLLIYYPSRWIVLKFIKWLFKREFNDEFSLYDISPVKHAKNIHLPALIFHSSRDHMIPLYHSLKLKSTIPGKVLHFDTRTFGHSRCYRWKEYYRTLLKFMETSCKT